MASLPSNLSSSRRNSDSPELVSLSSSDSEEDSDADYHRSCGNSADVLEPPKNPSSPRERNSASQGSAVATVASSLADDEGSLSESSVTIPQQRARVTYELFDPDQLTKTEYEDKGLLFAKSSKTKFNM